MSEGEKVLQPLRKFGSLADGIRVMGYVQIQQMFQPFFPPGRYTHVKSNFMQSLNDQAIEVIAEFADKRPSPYTFAPILEHWHGAVSRVGVSDTAFPHRHRSYNSSSGPIGRMRPTQNKTSSGHGNMGKRCGRTLWPARMATTSRTKETPSREPPTALIMIGWFT
jgi:hypothetical protein